MKRLLWVIVGLLLLPTFVFAQFYLSTEFDVSVTPNVQNASYSSGNAIGGLQTITPFRSVQPTGILNNISVLSNGGSTTPVTFYIFKALPSSATICTDKTAFVLAAADQNKLINAIPPVLTPAVVGAGTTATTASQQLPISIRNQDTPTTTKLYICPVVGGAVTPASTSDLVFGYSGIRD